MTVHEAKEIINDYYLSESHTEEEEFVFEEAQHFLIDAMHDPNDMHNLAWHYAEERKFDLYLKYLEMAAEYQFYPSYESLGYLWYYGQTGTVDYEKAFYYFNLGAGSKDDYIRISCEYKIADMYRYGYFVEKDEEKYRTIIERLFEEVSHPEDLNTIISMEFYPEPALSYRVAEIRIAQGKMQEAKRLLQEARTQFAIYLQSNPSWWGNIEEMESVVMLMHENAFYADRKPDLYDIFWLAKSEGKLSFNYLGQRFTVHFVAEDGGIVIKFEDKWYRDANSFLEKAMIGGRPVTALYNKLTEYK